MREWRQFLLLWALLPGAGAVQAAVTASVDANPVRVGEGFTLEITVTGDLDGEPDVSVLDREFRILNRSSGSRYSIVNGRTERSRSWTLTLMPRRAGRITIPAFAVAGQRSDPIELQVIEAGAAGDDEPRPAIVEMELGSEPVYVGQQIALTVRVLLNGNFVNTGMGDPRADAAVIERIGEQREYAELRDGVRYRVYERRYVLFPETPGELRLSAPVFQGEVNLRGAPRAPMGLDLFGGPRQPVVATAPERRITVRPPPAGAGTPWLPAIAVELADALIPEAAEYRVGEPLTREIRLRVDGQLHTQLADLAMDLPDGAQAYPDTPEGQTLGGPDGVRAEQTVRVAIIPTAAGTLRLPAVEVPWWDTRADEARVARVPARTLTVLPAIGTEPPPAPGSTDDAEAAGDADVQPGQPRVGTTADGVATTWRSIALAALVGWLLTGLGWLNSLRSRITASAGSADTRVVRSRRALHRALRGTDPRACRAAVIDWARARLDRPQLSSLAELGPHLDEPGRIALAELDAACWGGREDWSAAALEAALEKLAASSRRDSRRDPGLPPLYPAR